MSANSVCIAALFLAGGALGQSLTQHAAAAAGAAIGTGGGKILSNVLDSTLSKAAATGTDAAVAAKPKPVQTKVAGPAPSPAVPASPDPAPVAVSRQARAPRTDMEHSVDRVMERPVDTPAAPPPPPSPEDFAKLKEGSPREDVLAALGTPGSHITIPDEGHLLETLTYYDGRRLLGTVRLDNGQVVSIAPSPR